MKKLSIVIVVLIIAGGAWWYLGHKNLSNPQEKPVQVAQNTTHPSANNATFIFEDGPVALKDGSATTNVTPNGEVTQDTTLTDDVAYGDINKDGKTDAAVLLVQSGSGSGTFLYIAVYLSGNVEYKGSNAVFIGDRVTPKTISIDTNGKITVTYLDRAPSAPMASEPTIPTTKHYIVSNGQLEEK